VLSRKLSPERWQKLQPVLGKLLSVSQFTPIYYSWRPTSPDPGVFCINPPKGGISIFIPHD
jgi:hypothetical protein